MTLIPAMKTRLAAPSDLVDLGHIADLKGITVSGKTITIGGGDDACRGRRQRRR